MRYLVILVAAALGCTAKGPPPQPPPTPAELEALAGASIAFAFDLHGRLRREPGNLIFSPFGISTGLLAAWPGTSGETSAQLGRVLHARGDPWRTAWVSGRHVAALQVPRAVLRLEMASRIYVDRAAPLERSWLAHANATWGAPPDRVDFRGAAEDARREINAWVAETTHGRFSEVVRRGGVDQNTRLVLASAIYFKGTWEKPFRSEATSPATFQLDRATEKDVPTMRQVEHLRFASPPGLKLLDLFFEGREFSMTFLLPDLVDGLDAMERSLTPEDLARWLESASFRKVDLALPRFEFRPPPRSLLAPLVELGMMLAFDPKAADFTAMAVPRTEADRVFLADLIHQASLKLDEQGTEAAAATTGLAAGALGRGHPPLPPTVEFHADHPFLFLLREVSTGTILFMGRVADPAPGEQARASSSGTTGPPTARPAIGRRTISSPDNEHLPSFGEGAGDSRRRSP